MKRLKCISLLLVVFIPLCIGLAIAGYFGLERGTPSVDELLRQRDRIASGTKIFAEDGSLIAQINAQKGIYRSLNEMPSHLINAVIATEDSRFFSHQGVDIIAVARAFSSNVSHGGITQGGSTITQQLAKVAFLSPERTIRRKLREAYLAIKLENRISKKEILALYLNEVYFGHGAYGVEMAANVYFNKSVNELALPESAILAGLIRGPLLYSPFLNESKARKRQTEVLERMLQEGFIGPEQAEDALRMPVILSAHDKRSDENGYFIDYVIKYLEDKYSPKEIYQTGLMVYTTLSPQAQHEAQEALRNGLLVLDKRRGWRGPLRHGSLKTMTYPVEATFQKELEPGALTEAVVRDVTPKRALLDVNGRTGTLMLKNAAWAQNMLDPETGKARHLQILRLDKLLKAGDVVLVRVLKITSKTLFLALEQEPEAQGALISLEPSSGYVRSLVGGYDYGTSQFNRALYAKRQPGSAFKPIIYAAALEKGRTPATIIEDEPITYIDEMEEEWTPQNYEDEHYGPTTLREALVFSRNVVSIRLLEDIGIDTVIRFAKALGIKGDFPRDLTLALGTLSVTPLELVRAYSPFANGGILTEPIFVKEVVGPSGSVLESNVSTGTAVLSPETAFQMTSMLQDAVAYGTAQRAAALGRIDLAAKTGTTNEFRDAWFIGYNPTLITGIWVGYDDMTSLGENEAGARAAGPIWVEFMRTALEGQPEMIYELPESITSYIVNSETGLIANSPPEELSEPYYWEYFKEGSEPMVESGPEIPQQEKQDFNIFN